MFEKIFLGLIFLGWHQMYLCNEHTYGTFRIEDSIVFAKELFNKTTLQPKNYTVIFKYMSPAFTQHITYANFKVHNAFSTATIEVNSTDKNDRTVQATLNIFNATRISVTAQLYGQSVRNLGAVVDPFKNYQSKPKTFTVVYGHNATQTRNRKINLGQRQAGDHLLNFQSKNVTLPQRVFKKFAEDDFIYDAGNSYITSVQFSFDSPTAIAFLNSTQIKPNSIEAIVYDLNSPYFGANMSVFGFNSHDRPITYQSIVTANKIQQ